MNNRISTGYFLAVIATVIWAGNFIVARALNQEILPIGLAFWRWAIAVVTLAPFALRSTVEDWKLVHWRSSVGLSLLTANSQGFYQFFSLIKLWQVLSKVLC